MMTRIFVIVFFNPSVDHLYVIEDIDKYDRQTKKRASGQHHNFEKMGVFEATASCMSSVCSMAICHVAWWSQYNHHKQLLNEKAVIEIMTRI